MPDDKNKGNENQDRPKRGKSPRKGTGKNDQGSAGTRGRGR
jgi:hypothetical protein